VFGRGQAGDGIVADMRRLRTVHAIEDDRVVADAGATWREVLGAGSPRPGSPTTSTCRSAARWSSAASAAASRGSAC
jgi:FAD/FMN-containing dehydrogenase